MVLWFDAYKRKRSKNHLVPPSHGVITQLVEFTPCAVAVQSPESCALYSSGTRRTVGTSAPSERRCGRAPHRSLGQRWRHRSHSPPRRELQGGQADCGTNRRWLTPPL